MPKSAVGPVNNSKNKLNSKIIFIYNPNPNACYIPIFFYEFFYFYFYKWVKEGNLNWRLRCGHSDTQSHLGC